MESGIHQIRSWPFLWYTPLSLQLACKSWGANLWTGIKDIDMCQRCVKDPFPQRVSCKPSWFWCICTTSVTLKRVRGRLEEVLVLRKNIRAGKLVHSNFDPDQHFLTTSEKSCMKKSSGLKSCVPVNQRRWKIVHEFPPEASDDQREHPDQRICALLVFFSCNQKN